MRFNHVIANEVISVDASRDLGPLVEKVVAKMVDSQRSLNTIPAELGNELRDVIQIIGFKTEIILVPNAEPNAACYVEAFDGHSSIDYNRKGDSVRKRYIMENINDTLKVDMVKVKVSGSLADKIYVRFVFNAGLFDSKFNASVKEITSVVLHEIGHAFDAMMFLGQYAYYNYALSEGIDILLGNKKNIYNVQVVDTHWLDKNVPKEQMAAFKANPTVAGATQVILGGFDKDVRGYLYSNSAGSWKRNEQSADQFSTRLGYAREAIAVQAKLDHLNMGRKEFQRTMAVMNAVQIGMAVLTLPLALGFAVLAKQDGQGKDSYDDPVDRVKRMRMDLVTQLKHISDKGLKASILADIEASDKIIADYLRKPSAYDQFTRWVNPTRRQAVANIKHEQNLEELLNNQLFVDAYKFNPKDK